jgi:hypothetical protein
MVDVKVRLSAYLILGDGPDDTADIELLNLIRFPSVPHHGSTFSICQCCVGIGGHEDDVVDIEYVITSRFDVDIVLHLIRDELSLDHVVMLKNSGWMLEASKSDMDRVEKAIENLRR